MAVKSSLEFADDEIAARRAGSETVLAKLSELLFSRRFGSMSRGFRKSGPGGWWASRTPTYHAL